MQLQGVVPNVITYNAQISACEKGEQPKQVLKLFQVLQLQGGVPDSISMNSLILACSASGEWERVIGSFTDTGVSGLRGHLQL